jgi:hypothetical protein
MRLRGLLEVTHAVHAKRRSENPKIGHVRRPDASMTLMGVQVRTNFDGFRDREYDVAHGGTDQTVDRRSSFP